MENENTATPETSSPRARSGTRLVGAIVTLALAVVVLVLARRVDPVSADTTVAHADAPRRVLVSRARRAAEEIELRLPGSTAAVEESLVVARASGYVSRIAVNIGAHVRAGQVLAELRAPETMDELRAAEARVADATQTLAYARQSSERITTLSGQGVTTPQELDDARFAVATAEATLHAQTADAARLRTLRRFQTVLAPFDGVVTERLVDVGALVSSTAGDGLFRIATLDRIEVVVDVPQVYAPLVRVGQALDVERPDAPGATVQSTVARAAGDLATATRTMRIEAELPGDAGLLGGMFVNVKLHVHRADPPVVIPSRAISIRGGEITVWVVEDGRAHARVIAIARDLGREVELATGLRGGETIILSPPDGLTENDVVDVVERPVVAPR